MSNQKLIQYEIHGVHLAQSLGNFAEWYCGAVNQDNIITYSPITVTPTTFLEELVAKDSFKYFPVSFTKAVTDELQKRPNGESPKTSIFTLGDYDFTNTYMSGWAVSPKGLTNWIPLHMLYQQDIDKIHRALEENKGTVTLPIHLVELILNLKPQGDMVNDPSKVFLSINQGPVPSFKMPKNVGGLSNLLRGYFFHSFDNICWKYLAPTKKQWVNLNELSIEELRSILVFSENTPGVVPSKLVQEAQFLSIVKQELKRTQEPPAEPMSLANVDIMSPPWSKIKPTKEDILAGILNNAQSYIDPEKALVFSWCGYFVAIKRMKVDEVRWLVFHNTRYPSKEHLQKEIYKSFKTVEENNRVYIYESLNSAVQYILDLYR